MRPSSPTQLLRVTEDHSRLAAHFPRATRLTEENAAAVGREFAALLAGREGPQVALDLRAVEYLTGVALGELVRVHWRVRAAGGRLTLVNPTPLVRRDLAVCRLDRMFDLGAAA